MNSDRDLQIGAAGIPGQPRGQQPGLGRNVSRQGLASTEAQDWSRLGRDGGGAGGWPVAEKGKDGLSF